MKLHLPSSLRRSLLASLGLVLGITCAGVVEASYQHQDVSIQTYTDFGQNKGRYVVGNTNALLQYLNQDGVKITYTGGQEAYTMEHGMIDFDSQVSSGEAAAIGYNFIATVAHVTVVDEHYNGGLMDFTRNNLGRENCVLYTGIEYAVKNGTSSFQLKPNVDYKITRLSKLVTDVSGSAVYGSVDGDYSLIAGNGLAGELLYRSGSGHMYKTSEDGSRNWCANPYTYITGGIDTIGSLAVNSSDGSYSVNTYFTYTGDEVGKSEPLPYKADQGDSGSPSWVWNENTQQYEYIAALQSGNEYNYSQFRGNCEWTNETMASFDVGVTMGSGNAVYLNAITGVGESLSDSGVGASTTLRYGLVTDADGNELARYNGVQSGTHTWKNLAALKDTSNWYNYGDEYLNATKESSASASLTWADLFHNDNLVITAASSSEVQNVVLNDTVDLGIGYAQFSLGQGMETADFVVTSAEGESNLLNSAGFVVDKGVSLHLQLTNPADYMREWRKVGEGDLHIEGNGNNDIFLNIGGSGKTYLQREGGYAAYNVLVNNGSTVVIDDINQIKRDLTFGNRGGVLDMNGCKEMEWNNDLGAGAEGFTIHALDEGAVVANLAEDTHTTLTWTQGGEQTWLGSFADTVASSLDFIYNGGANARLILHSIYTKLVNAASGMEVRSGTVILVGTNTEHALGSQGAWNSSARYSSDEDWHYADAQMNVSVANGATFELGSHARLTGDVTVASGGTYIMREGVKHRMEFIEGGYVKEDTNAIRDFFGHKGNVSLDRDASLQISFSEGTDSRLVYNGNISGAGNVWVDTGSGILQLGGNNSFSGTKNFTSGGLHADSNAALGDTTTNKWVIEEKAWLASDGFTDASQILTHIDSSSSGVLALSRDVEGEIDLSGHTSLIIGAAEDCSVRYGTQNETLTAINNRWVLGGGGGNLDVAFRLTGQNDLVLGNAYGKGNVHLSNSSNDFSGDVLFVGAVTLTYDEGALGNAMLNLSYGNRALLTASDLSKVKSGSQGVVLVDRMLGADVDFRANAELSLGASEDVTYTGNIVVSEGNPYRFGGGDGCLTVASALESGHDMVIDGQGCTGGSVVLTNAQNFSGVATIIGSKTSARSTSGEVTLRFESDNSMTSARGFIIGSGGKLDLAGTNQRLAGVELGNGSIIDSSEGKSSTLTITSGTLGAGTVDVAHIVKAGSGTLTLNNSTNFSDFAVTEGTLQLQGAANGSFRVEGSGIMNLNGYDATGTLTLGSGASLSNVSGLSAALRVEGDSVLRVSSRGADVKGAISVAEGAELSVQAGSASISITKASSLSGAGQVSITTSGSTAYIDGNHSAFTGRLSITGTGSNEAKFSSVAAMGAGSIVLDKVALTLDETGTASAASLEVGSGGAAYRDSSGSAAYLVGLSGSGTLRGQSYYDSGALWFSGQLRGFTGTLDNDSTTTAFRYGFGGDGVSYHSLTANESADAAALFGAGAKLNSSYGAATYEFCYTDRVALNASVSGNANVTQSGTGTLVLGSGNTSTGTLTINEGGTVEVTDASSWMGSLAGKGSFINLSKEEVTIASSSGFAGNLELVQGSTLTLGTSGTDTLSLGAGQTLAVLSGAAGSKDSVTLNVSTLVLNGGSLTFSSEALANEGGALLWVNGSISKGANAGSGITVSFGDTSYLLANKQYLLAQGSFSSLSASDFVVEGLDSCYTATFSLYGNRQLFVTLAQTAGNRVWAGSANNTNWNTGFGSAPATTDTLWFNDTAAVKNVVVSTARTTAAGLVFNATEDYTFTVNSGATLSVTNLELKNSGKVTISGTLAAEKASMVEGSELVLKNSIGISGGLTGPGTLTIDTGANSVTMAASGLDTLKIVSGCYTATDTRMAEHIVVEGGQFFLNNAGTNTYEKNFTLAGEGWTHNTKESVNAASLCLVGTTHLTGTITLASDTAIAVASGTTNLRGNLVSNGHVLTKRGTGLLRLDANNSFTTEGSSFVVAEGELRFGSSVGDSLPTGIESITVENSATLGLQVNGGTIDSRLVFKDKSSFNLSSGVSNTAHKEYTLTGAVELSGGETSITTTKSRKLIADGVLSGTGGLSLEGSGALELVLNNAANSFEGGISTLRSGVTLTLGCAEAAGTGRIYLGHDDARMSVSGNADAAGSFGKLVNNVTGAGSVELASGRVEMSGSNSYGGTTTVKKGATLKLTGSNSGSSSYVVEKEAQLLLAGEGFATTSNKGVTLRAAGNVAARSLARTAAEGVLENVTVGDESMTATADGSFGRVQGALVSVDAREYAISNIEFTESRVQVSTQSTNLSLSDLVLDSATTFSATAPDVTLSMLNVSLTMNASPSDVYEDGADFGLSGSSVAVCTLQNFSQMSLTGNLTLNATEWEIPEAVDYVAIDFGSDVDVSNLTATITFADGRSLDALHGMPKSVLIFSLPTKAIPEPTTSALALLGLGILALRRRRK